MFLKPTCVLSNTIGPRHTRFPSNVPTQAHYNIILQSPSSLFVSRLESRELQAISNINKTWFYSARGHICWRNYTHCKTLHLNTEMSKTRAEPSVETETRELPSAEMARDCTTSAWPLKVLAQSPDKLSQMRTLPSMHPDATYLDEPNHTTDVTPSSCSQVHRLDWWARSQIMSFWSMPPVATQL